ncbi:F-box protein like [Capsicum chacoense]
MKHFEINKMDVDGTMEILSRLPVRSLLRFKCVLKFRMALISEPYFTLKHLNRAKNDQNSQRFLVSQWSSLYCSSFNALRKYKNLIVLQTLNYGVASYIVVMIAWRLSGFIIIVIIPINFGYGTHPPENQYEVYTEIPLPEQMLSIYNQTWGVSVLTEKLCAYAHYTSQTFRFWVMRDYGVKESCTELFHIQVAGFLLVIPKYRFSDGELLLCCRDLAFRPVFRTSKGPLGLCPQSNSSQKGVHCLENAINICRVGKSQ